MVAMRDGSTFWKCRRGYFELFEVLRARTMVAGRGLERTMENRKIMIGEPTARALRALLQARGSARHDQEHLEELRSELERAIVMEPHALSPTVVTMNAVVRVHDLQSDHAR